MELGIFGFGYSANALVASCVPQGTRIWHTARRANAGDSYAYEAGCPAGFVREREDTTHVLISIPPIDGAGGVARALIPALQTLPQLAWVGYYSTTGVYGDAGGDWVDETTRAEPQHARGAARLAEEEVLLQSGLPVHIFRIAGIYGLGRSALDQLRAGTARRIEKPGHVFSRIHVQDIARATYASMMQPSAGSIYNLADDLPAPAHEVTAYAAGLLGMTPPPLEAYEDIAESLSPMMREFYAGSRRISNRKIKGELGVNLAYPTYREGLEGLLKPHKT